MTGHAHQKFFTGLLNASSLTSTDRRDANAFFEQLTPDQADFFYVLLSEDESWLPRILANYRAKCAAFRDRDDRVLDEILRTELAELDVTAP